jgi:hypothetical protein
MDCPCDLLMNATNAKQYENCIRSNLKDITLGIIDILVTNLAPHF